MESSISAIILIHFTLHWLFKREEGKLIWKTKSGTDFTLFAVSEKVVNAVVQETCWKQDILFSECAELVTGLKRGCETLSALIFFGCHFAVELLF